MWMKMHAAHSRECESDERYTCGAEERRGSSDEGSLGR